MQMLREDVTKCPCPKKRCKYHSKCDLCIQRHSKKKSKPYCEKGENTLKKTKKENRLVAIIATISILAVITGIILILFLPENPLFNLTIPIRILICGALLVFLCLLILFRNRMGLFITFTIVVLVLFFVTVGVFSSGYRYYKADLPQYRDTINLASHGIPRGNILIVFHPGASSSTIESVTTFAEELTTQGCNVEISTANPDLKPDFSDYDLVVIASNIYNRKVRPPIIEFVENNDLTDVNVFTLFVGSHRKRVQEELDLFLPYLNETSAIHIGHFKYPKAPVEELIQCAKEVAEMIG